MNTTRARKGNRRGRRAIWIWVVTLSTLAGLLEATETRIFRQRTRAELSRGTLEGLALTAEGALRPATRFERGAEIEEPYVFSAVRSPNGWWLGTGNAGRLLEVGDDGSVRTAWTAPEPEIFALHAEEGAVYVGSSPRGGVYELESGELESGGLENGEAEKIFDPEATYVWSIARAPWGELIVATGDPGHLYAIDGDGASTLLYESEEPHLRSLLAVGDQVLVGTSGEGRVLSLTADGSVRTVYDSDLPEVVGFAASPEGRWFAAAVSSEASLSAPRQGANGGSAQEPAVEVSVEPAESVDSAASTPRTILLAGRGATGAEEVARLDEETGYALAWIDGRIWLGTGVEGKVYSLYPEGLSLEATAGDRQVVALFGGEPASLVTTNGAAVYTAAGRGQGGTYLSQPLDAEATARFGRLRWLGSADDESAVLFSVRSGSSSTPDRTWSGWSAARSGREIDLAEVPAGRYVQWRLQLEPGFGEQAAVTSVEVSYRQHNRAPTIRSFEAMAPGQVLVPSSFNPGDQIYEPAHPDREGMFTVLEPTQRGSNGRLKTLWRKGYLTLRWEAEDANGDPLEYDLHFRPEPGRGAQRWFPLAEGIDETYYGFDATVLPDGVYRFQLTASDGGANDESEGREVAMTSAPVVVDHSPPSLDLVTGRTVRVADALSPIRSAEVSIDAGEWSPARSEDGLLDGKSETLVVEPQPDAGLVLLRVMDAAFNSTTFEVREETP